MASGGMWCNRGWISLLLLGFYNLSEPLGCPYLHYVIIILHYHENLTPLPLGGGGIDNGLSGAPSNCNGSGKTWTMNGPYHSGCCGCTLLGGYSSSLVAGQTLE